MTLGEATAESATPPSALALLGITLSWAGLRVYLHDEGPSCFGAPTAPWGRNENEHGLGQAWCQPALHLTLQVCLSLLAAALRTSSSSISGENNGPEEVQPASPDQILGHPCVQTAWRLCFFLKNSNCCMFDFRSMKTKYDPALSRDMSCADERGVRGFQAKGRGMTTGNRTPMLESQLHCPF